MEMATECRRADSKGRVALPSGFAGAMLLIEYVSETEVRIRKAHVIPEDEVVFSEQGLKPLSDRDRDVFLAGLEKPPEPNAALRKAAERYKKRHG